MTDQAQDADWAVRIDAMGVDAYDLPDGETDTAEAFGIPDDATEMFGALEEPPAEADPAFAPALAAIAAAKPEPDYTPPAPANAAPLPVIPAAASATVDAVVPRIAIEAFCDRPDMAEVIEAAGRDRRLSKASLTVRPGGLAAALDALATQSSPNLIILDTMLPASDLLRDLDHLAPLVEPTTKVVVIGATNDIRLYRELMRRGVSEYLVAPEPVQVIESIAALYVDPERPFVGRVCAVAGVRGGVGASTLAHNLAYMFAERFQTATTLVDLDLHFGTVALDFNQDAASGVLDALSAPDRVDEVFLERLLIKQSERLSLFTAPANLDRDGEIDTAACEIVLDRVRRMSPLTVLDLPHRWSPWVREAILSASEVVLVATPDLGALRNCKNMVDLVRAARPHDPPPTVVLNQAGVPKRPEVPAKDFADALGVEPAAIIPFDPAVFGAAANNGQMLSELAPTSKPALAIEALARRISGRDPAPKAKNSLLAKVPFLNR